MRQIAQITKSKAEAVWEDSGMEGPKFPCQRSSGVAGNM